MDEPLPAEYGKSYRIRVKYKNWIGKPDPSGFSEYYVYSDDPAWLHEEALRRKRLGDKILATEKREGTKWIKM